MPDFGLYDKYNDDAFTYFYPFSSPMWRADSFAAHSHIPLFGVNNLPRLDKYSNLGGFSICKWRQIYPNNTVNSVSLFDVDFPFVFNWNPNFVSNLGNFSYWLAIGYDRPDLCRIVIDVYRSSYPNPVDASGKCIIKFEDAFVDPSYRGPAKLPIDDVNVVVNGDSVIIYGETFSIDGESVKIVDDGAFVSLTHYSACVNWYKYFRVRFYASVPITLSMLQAYLHGEADPSWNMREYDSISQSRPSHHEDKDLSDIFDLQVIPAISMRNYVQILPLQGRVPQSRDFTQFQTYFREYLSRLHKFNTPSLYADFHNHDFYGDQAITYSIDVDNGTITFSPGYFYYNGDIYYNSQSFVLDNITFEGLNYFYISVPVGFVSELSDASLKDPTHFLPASSYAGAHRLCQQIDIIHDTTGIGQLGYQPYLILEGTNLYYSADDYHTYQETYFSKISSYLFGDVKCNGLHIDAVLNNVDSSPVLDINITSGTLFYEGYIYKLADSFHRSFNLSELYTLSDFCQHIDDIVLDPSDISEDTRFIPDADGNGVIWDISEDNYNMFYISSFPSLITSVERDSVVSSDVVSDNFINYKLGVPRSLIRLSTPSIPDASLPLTLSVDKYKWSICYVYIVKCSPDDEDKALETSFKYSAVNECFKFVFSFDERIDFYEKTFPRLGKHEGFYLGYIIFTPFLAESVFYQKAQPIVCEFFPRHLTQVDFNNFDHRLFTLEEQMTIVTTDLDVDDTVDYLALEKFDNVNSIIDRSINFNTGKLDLSKVQQIGEIDTMQRLYHSTYILPDESSAVITLDTSALSNGAVSSDDNYCAIVPSDESYVDTTETPGFLPNPFLVSWSLDSISVPFNNESVHVNKKLELISSFTNAKFDLLYNARSFPTSSTSAAKMPFLYFGGDQSYRLFAFDSDNDKPFLFEHKDYDGDKSYYEFYKSLIKKSNTDKCFYFSPADLKKVFYRETFYQSKEKGHVGIEHVASNLEDEEDTSNLLGDYCYAGGLDVCLGFRSGTGADDTYYSLDYLYSLYNPSGSKKKKSSSIVQHKSDSQVFSHNKYGSSDYVLSSVNSDSESMLNSGSSSVKYTPINRCLYNAVIIPKTSDNVNRDISISLNGKPLKIVSIDTVKADYTLDKANVSVTSNEFVPFSNLKHTPYNSPGILVKDSVNGDSVKYLDGDYFGSVYSGSDGVSVVNGASLSTAEYYVLWFKMPLGIPYGDVIFTLAFHYVDESNKEQIEYYELVYKSLFDYSVYLKSYGASVMLGEDDAYADGEGILPPVVYSSYDIVEAMSINGIEIPNYSGYATIYYTLSGGTPVNALSVSFLQGKAILSERYFIPDAAKFYIVITPISSLYSFFNLKFNPMALVDHINPITYENFKVSDYTTDDAYVHSNLYLDSKIIVDRYPVSAVYNYIYSPSGDDSLVFDYFSILRNEVYSELASSPIVTIDKSVAIVSNGEQVKSIEGIKLNHVNRQSDVQNATGLSYSYEVKLSNAHLGYSIPYSFDVDTSNETLSTTISYVSSWIRFDTVNIYGAQLAFHLLIPKNTFRDNNSSILTSSFGPNMEKLIVQYQTPTTDGWVDFPVIGGELNKNNYDPLINRCKVSLDSDISGSVYTDYTKEEFVDLSSYYRFLLLFDTESFNERLSGNEFNVVTNAFRFRIVYDMPVYFNNEGDFDFSNQMSFLLPITLHFGAREAYE